MIKLNILSVFLLISIAISSQEKNQDSIPVPEPKSFITSHEITNGGNTISYKAIASETYLKGESGEPVASIWSVAYVKEGTNDITKRPVTFVFNGGPGSASVWLHMGMFGPELIKVNSDAKEDDGAAPYNLVTNKNGLLDLTDFVFVDPVGTGYSRVIGKGKVEDYWGLNEDANSIAKFIRQWITENKRWFSPKYIAGESFGTTRAAAVANTLEGDGQNMALNGLILISQALDYDGSTSVHDNITSYLTYLPSMAATAWYHKKAGQGKTLESFIDECRKYTYNSYASVLYKGSLITEDEKNEAAEKLSYFTGLKKDYILKSDLRILMPRFQKELLADQGLAVGRLDGRFMGDEVDKLSDGPHLGDPSSYQISSAYTAALNHYYASELKIKMDRPYLTSNDEIGEKWNWRTVPKGKYWEPTPVNVTRKLSETMRRNTEMKVMVASGYFDLICPFFDAEYTFSRNGIRKEKIKMTYYEGGHMMYTHEPDFIKLSNDIREFLSN
ncbi:S10 family peptidase [Sediminicola arcticus]|uniref:Peptidase S10 n=1 Tax=Sediminicola arcticus TaxID=1574308 RepID=A0ABV2SWR4_9FLAO